MTSHVSGVDSDNSSDSRPSIFVINAEASSSSSSSSSSSCGTTVAPDWSTAYRKLPKHRSLSLRFMTWAAGRPRNANCMKKKCRDDERDRELFRVSTSTLIGSMLGRWPTETRMYWVDVDNEKYGGGIGHGARRGTSSADGDGEGDKDETRRVFVMSGGSGNEADGGRPVYMHSSGIGIPPPIPQMDPRYPGIPRFPPGMGGVPPATG
ncbi:hypothetical protein NLU13_7650 [Sarocladium strictum]|uniref:Uncharacterized protein n=1 Tax=Sarocladium strictum TaxID=5046 RepID=A0AA39L5S6_SARSR|nr:hypothetical protein NLU13_7650 [Sarocladium strictum]